MKKISKRNMDYELLRQRIDCRCKLLSIASVGGMSDDRLAAIRGDARGISTLELTQLSRALHVSIASLVFGKDGKS